MKPIIPEGATVYVKHLRYFEELPSPITTHEAKTVFFVAGPPTPKGGITLAQIEFADGRTVRGSARCNPLDTYNKAIGRNVAIGRALKAAGKAGAV
jgi:hypothetical protein